MKIAGAQIATSTFAFLSAGSLNALIKSVTVDLVPFNFQLPITTGFLMILSSINTFFDTAVSAVLIEYHFLFSTQTFGILL